MPEGIEQALANCLEKIEQGKATIEESLREYPELRVELEPLLGLAQDLRSLPKVRAPESLRTSKRPVFTPWYPEPIDLQAQRRSGPTSRLVALWGVPLARLAAGIALVFLLLGGAAVASAGSLPEEPLYPLKLAMEELRLAITPNPEARAELEMRFAERRLEEVESAARQGRVEALQRGLALYEERVASAVTRVELAPPATDESQAQRRQEKLERQQETLSRVLNQVPEQARPAVLHALEVSTRGHDRTDKPKGEPKDGDVSKPGRASGTPAAPAATATPAAATGTPKPASDRVPGRKAKHEATPTASEGAQDKEHEPQEKESTGSRGGARPEPEVRKPELRTRSATPTPTVAPVATATALAGTATPAPSPHGIPTYDRTGREREREGAATSTPTAAASRPNGGNRQGPEERKEPSSEKEERDRETSSKKAH